MKTITNHLGQILLAVAAVALVVGVVLSFATPIGNMFNSVIGKTQEQAQGDIWNMGTYDVGGYNAGGGSGDEEVALTFGQTVEDGDYIYTYMGCATLEDQRNALKPTLEAQTGMAWADIVTNYGGGDEEAVWEMLGITDASFTPVDPQWSVAAANTDIIGSNPIKSELEGAPVTTLYSGAFRGCTGLTSIEIPAGVTTIGDRAFYKCTSLESVTFGENGQLTTIGEQAFQDCTNLTSIEIPGRVTSIGSYAFSDGTNIEAVYFEGTLEQWCSVTFGNNYAHPCYYGAALYIQGELADDIVIPSTVTEIKARAFYGCTSLTSVTIPASVTSIGEDAFRGNYTSLKTVRYEGTLEQWCNISFDDQDANPCANSAALYIQNDLADEIVIPSTVTEIKAHAFYGCTSLTSVEIPSSVTTIGEHAFNSCSSLASVTFGENSQLTSISDYAFQYSGVTSVEIPVSVTSIGNKAFYYCSSLTSITIQSETLVAYSSSMLSDCRNLTAIYVPADLVDDYQAASGWSNFSSKIQAIQ